MLAYDDGKGGWIAWQPGTRMLNPDGTKGLTPPTTAETALSTEELATLGLHRVVVEAVPDGKIATGYTLVDNAGVPTWRPALADPPPPPTSAELAAQFDRIEGRTTTMELAFRALLSLLADRMSVTDAQAKTAIRNRMQAIAEGTRG